MNISQMTVQVEIFEVYTFSWILWYASYPENYSTAYLAKPTNVVHSYNTASASALHATHLVMAWLSKSIGMTSEMIQPELMLHPDD